MCDRYMDTLNAANAAVAALAARNVCESKTVFISAINNFCFVK